MISTSKFFSINTVDVWKAIRSGFISAVSVFFSASLLAGQAQISTGVFDGKTLITTCLIAGITAVLDLARRFLVDYSSQKERIVIEK